MGLKRASLGRNDIDQMGRLRRQPAANQEFGLRSRALARWPSLLEPGPVKNQRIAVAPNSLAPCVATIDGGCERLHFESIMDAHLPEAFRALAELKAPVTDYKICSTLDSSPALGSIGRAIDIGAPIFAETPGAANWQPLIVAAPAIGRCQAFGNLFAASGDSVYRLDPIRSCNAIQSRQWMRPTSGGTSESKPHARSVSWILPP